jgi:nucleotide-binding universal stress UspA family protein
VLRAWSLTNAPRPASMAPGYVPPEEDFQQAVLEQLSRDVHALHLPQDCTVELHAAHGQSSAKLLEAAVGAEILVVGRRGSGGFRGLLTGSTADQVVRHAPCPVVVVPVTGQGA